MYVWFDTEYSTLELEDAWILQVAAIITDGDLRRILPSEQDIRLAIRLPEDRVLSPWVELNLRDLVEKCRSFEAVDIAEADDLLAAYVDSAAGAVAEREDLRPVLAGNSVHADWWLARRFLPQFTRRLNYRHLDVTALNLEWKRHGTDTGFEKEKPEDVRRYFPEAVLLPSRTRHDAYYDIQASIAELAFYRSHLLRYQNG
jgi:oligoribonuclease (3'-5' exoribonuclease)